MSAASIQVWLKAVLSRSGGDILAIQTLRNAIMAASVLASAALVAQMAVLASIKIFPAWVAWCMAFLLALCASLSVWAIVRFARCGFELQFQDTAYEALAAHIGWAIKQIQASAVLLITAMLLAALSIV